MAELTVYGEGVQAFWSICDARMPQPISDLDQRRRINDCLESAHRTLQMIWSGAILAEPIQLGSWGGVLQSGVKEACQSFWRTHDEQPFIKDRLFVHECVVMAIAAMNRHRPSRAIR